MIKQHILVVDDNAAIRTFLKIRLEYSGHTVDLAENGREGLMMLGHGDYDVVLLDYMMPGITGLMVFQHIQQRHPSIPVVMITGQVASQALAAGARACLYKPFGCKKFENILRSMLGTTSLRAVASGEVTLS